jgi:hypothetical protein
MDPFRNQQVLVRRQTMEELWFPRVRQLGCNRFQKMVRKQFQD